MRSDSVNPNIPFCPPAPPLRENCVSMRSRGMTSGGGRSGRLCNANILAHKKQNLHDKRIWSRLIGSRKTLRADETHQQFGGLCGDALRIVTISNFLKIVGRALLESALRSMGALGPAISKEPRARRAA